MKSQEKFKERLTELSINKNYKDIIGEWILIYHNNDCDNGQHCLCGSKGGSLSGGIKEQYCYINQFNNNIIFCGKSCRDKLSIKKKK